MPWWYYKSKQIIMKTCELLSGYSEESMKQNITLATSDWTGKLMESMYELGKYEVVFPPVDSPLSVNPWETRDNGFLCIARIVPEKMIDQAIEIIRRVREQGFDVSLHIIGRQDDSAYYNKIKDLCEENSSWATLHGILTKQQLFSLMSKNKFGINAAQGEPSGVAALEMVKSGSIVFMRDGGGLPEIVDIPDLTYNSVANGVDKIINVLASDSSQEKLLRRLSSQSKSFSTEVFTETIQRVTDEFFSKPVQPRSGS